MDWLSFLIGLVVGGIIAWLIGLFYWRREREACEKEKAALQAKCRELESALQRVPPVAAPQAPNDLKQIEGIGPKIEQLLNDHGIWTFAQLANTSVDRLRAILEAGGPNFRLADPTTWPEQARLAAEGAWDELRALQERLRAGREGR